MKANKYSWKKSEIIKRYFKCLKEIIHCKDKNKKLDLILDKQVLEDMILFTILKLPCTPSNPSLEDDLQFDKDFLSNETTLYQQEKIKEFIKYILDANFKITQVKSSYNKENIIQDCLSFLSTINKDIYDELNNSIKNNNIYLCNNKKERNYSGSTYYFDDISFYEVCINSVANPFMTINHELGHGYINNNVKRKFNKDSKIILYREVLSFLIELYANNYLYKENKISYDEFVSNFNDFFYTNVYDSIEIIDTLYYIAQNNNFDINENNVKNFIDSKRQTNENYNFDIDELTELPLKHHLIYFYSSMIALGIYYNYKDNEKEGLEVAFDIMKNVNEYNEEELLNKYNINPFESLNKYIDENNKLIKKMNN